MSTNVITATDIFSKFNKNDNSFYLAGNAVETIFNKPQNTRIITKDVEVYTEIDEKKPSKVERLYPQLLDNDLPEGKVLVFIKNALKNAQDALEEFDEPDLHATMSHLNQIAATMVKIHPLTTFNESLGSVVSYIRRAILLISFDDITRVALNSLISALHSMISNPLLRLTEASEIIENLSNSGWKGEHPEAEALISALFGDSEVTDNNKAIREFQDLICKIL